MTIDSNKDLICIEKCTRRGAVKDLFQGNVVIQPGTGFTSQPGVAVTTAHPRKNIQFVPNPKRGSTPRASFVPVDCGTPLGFVDPPFRNLGCAAMRRPQVKERRRFEPQRGSTMAACGRCARCGTPLGFGANGLFFLGCAVVTATPGFVVKPRWG